MIEPLPIGLLVAAVLGLVAYGVLAAPARADHGARPWAVAVYVGAVMLVMLVVALLAAGGAAIALVEQGLGPGAEAATRPVRPGTVAEAGSPTAELWAAVATAVLAAATFELHRRWLTRIRRSEGTAGPAAGAFRSYLYAVCLASLVALVVAGGGMASGAARALSPDPGADLPSRRGVPAVARPSAGGQLERSAGLAELIGNAVLAAFAFGLFAVHWRGAREERSVEDEGDAVRPA